MKVLIRYRKKKKKTSKIEEDMKDFPNAFLVTDKKGYYVADVYPIKIGNKGEITMLWKDGSHGVWKGKSWYEVRIVKYKGQDVIVENYKTVLTQKRNHMKEHKGEKMRKRDFHDFSLFNKKSET